MNDANEATHQNVGASDTERQLKRLGLYGGVLFGVLALTLIFVLETLNRQIGTYQSEIDPMRAATADIFESLADVYDHSAAALSTSSSAELAEFELADRVEERATGAVAALRASMEAEDVDALDASYASFAASADTLTAAVERGHAANESFDAALRAAASAVHDLQQAISAVEGTIALDYVLVLRELSERPSAGTANELIHGRVRELAGRAQDARSELDRFSLRVEQIGLTRSRDALNGLASNELNQASSAAAQAIAQLEASLPANDAARQELVAEISAAFASLVTSVQGEGGLVALRHAFFDAAEASSVARAEGRDRAAEVRDRVDTVEDAAAAKLAETQATVQNTVVSARFGALAVVLLCIGVCLASAFRLRRALRGLQAQNEQLRTLRDDLREANTTLEARVEARTRDLAQRESDTRFLLDSMGEALLKVDRDGRIVGERSKAADDWFGARVQNGAPVWDVLFADASLRTSFAFGWEQLADGFMPFELCADQLPKRFEEAGRVYDAELREIDDATILVIVRDHTAHAQAEAHERANREFQTVVANLLRDRKGFEITYSECERLLGELADTDDVTAAMRALHTLKGNTAVFGFTRVAECVHELESRVVERATPPSEGELEELAATWSASVSRLEDYLGQESDTVVQLHEDEVARLRRYLAQNRPMPTIRAYVDSWKNVPAKAQLEQLERQAERIAARLGKKVSVELEDDQLRFAHELAPFWTALVHVVRNAVDHGVECPMRREEKGKDPAGAITLGARFSSKGAFIEIRDDGAGIDEATLRAKYTGPIAEPTLLDLLCHDGLSARDDVTDTSGRGVGMAAVRAQCEALDIHMEVLSTPNEGTRFRFWLPDTATTRFTTDVLPEVAA